MWGFRGGLDEKTTELLEHFTNVLYVSCNPRTLHANIVGLLDKHRIKRFAVFDQVRMGSKAINTACVFKDVGNIGTASGKRIVESLPNSCASTYLVNEGSWGFLQFPFTEHLECGVFLTRK